MLTNNLLDFATWLFSVRFHLDIHKRNKKEQNLWLEQGYRKTLIYSTRSIYQSYLKVEKRFRRARITNKLNWGAKVAPHMQENRLKIVNRSKYGFLSWNKCKSSQQRCFINHWGKWSPWETEDIGLVLSLSISNVRQSNLWNQKNLNYKMHLYHLKIMRFPWNNLRNKPWVICMFWYYS